MLWSNYSNDMPELLATGGTKRNQIQDTLSPPLSLSPTNNHWMKRRASRPCSRMSLLCSECNGALLSRSFFVLHNYCCFTKKHLIITAGKKMSPWCSASYFSSRNQLVNLMNKCKKKKKNISEKVWSRVWEHFLLTVITVYFWYSTHAVSCLSLWRCCFFRVWPTSSVGLVHLVSCNREIVLHQFIRWPPWPVFLLQCWCFVKKKQVTHHCSHLVIVMSPYQMDTIITQIISRTSHLCWFVSKVAL